MPNIGPPLGGQTYRGLTEPTFPSTPTGRSSLASWRHGVDTALDNSKVRELLDWLVAMDDPQDVIGRENRRVVTMQQIIDRARAARDALDGAK